MKENIFRGKRKSDGEWAYGSLILVLEGAFILDQQINHILEKNLTFTDLDEMFQAVIPETVGQFIGRSTEKGNMLFEGDIVKRTCTEKIVAVRGTRVPCDAWEIGVIEFNNVSTKFEVIVIKQQDLWYGSLPHTTDFEYYNWKIIGNVTDNPGILKNSAYE
ncbi:hypothetical protein KAU33_02505 [Candidatus Dependentiae bacterium]|nr:hypothetical protein [Candidatus Dependentiae bacterium]